MRTLSLSLCFSLTRLLPIAAAALSLAADGSACIFRREQDGDEEEVRVDDDACRFDDDCPLGERCVTGCTGSCPQCDDCTVVVRSCLAAEIPCDSDEQCRDGEVCLSDAGFCGVSTTGSCALDECGPAPDTQPCPDGSLPAVACEQQQDATCGWSVRCAAPAP